MMISIDRTNRQERSLQYKMEREARVGRAWERFRAAMWSERRDLVPDTDNTGSRVGIMRYALRAGLLPDFRFESILSAEDVGTVEHLVDLRPAEPTEAPPGTRTKLEILAARAAAGEDLWSDGDATTFDDWIANTEDESR